MVFHAHRHISCHHHRWRYLLLAPGETVFRSSCVEDQLRHVSVRVPVESDAPLLALREERGVRLGVQAHPYVQGRVFKLRAWFSPKFMAGQPCIERFHRPVGIGILWVRRRKTRSGPRAVPKCGSPVSRSVISRSPKVGTATSGRRYLDTGSSNATSPRAIISARSVPVKVLLMDPISKTERGARGRASGPALP